MYTRTHACTHASPSLRLSSVCFTHCRPTLLFLHSPPSPPFFIHCFLAPEAACLLFHVFRGCWKNLCRCFIVHTSCTQRVLYLNYPNIWQIRFRCISKYIYIYGRSKGRWAKAFFSFLFISIEFSITGISFFFFFLKDRWLFESLNLKSINLLIDFLTIADLERFRNDMVRMFESSSLFFYADFFFSHEFEEQVDASLTFFSLPILTAINNCFFVSHITGWIDELYIYRHNPCILNLRVSFLS